MKMPVGDCRDCLDARIANIVDAADRPKVIELACGRKRWRGRFISQPAVRLER